MTEEREHEARLDEVSIRLDQAHAKMGEACEALDRVTDSQRLRLVCAPPSRPRVLCADDDQTFLAMLEQYLGAHGYRAVPACSLDEAAKRVAGGGIHAAVIDWTWKLPEQSVGAPLTLIVMCAARSVPSVLFTADSGLVPADVGMPTITKGLDGLKELLAWLAKVIPQKLIQTQPIRRDAP